MSEEIFILQETNISITAVEIFNDFIFIGEGSLLSAFDVSTHEVILKQDVLYGSTIHGICFKSSSTVTTTAVYGGRSIRVLNVDSRNLEILDIGTKHAVEDWIWDLKWNCGTDLLILVLGHNSLVLWDPAAGAVNQKVCCQEKCILYSACLVGDKWPAVGVLAGTVFRDVVLWTAADRLPENEQALVVQRLQGHLGVIFCVTVNVDLNLICSTSDDRTARVWQFSPAQSEQKFSDVLCWKEASFPLLHVLQGHESRVWRAAILPKTLITVGEDSKLCFWTHAGQLNRSQQCPGKGLWCMAISENRRTVATGGKDGTLAVHLVEREVKDTEICLPSFCTDKDFPRCLSLQFNAQQGNVILTLDSGLLLSYSLADCRWHKLYENERLRGYSVLSVESDGGEDIAVGSLTGYVYWIHCSSIHLQEIASVTEHLVSSTKVHSVLWLKNNDLLYLLTCGAQGQVDLWLACKDDNETCLKKSNEFILPVSKQHWVTAACIFDTTCAVGDRTGSVYIYSLQNMEKDPIQSLKNLHGQNGVTCMQKNKSFLYTAGKDGQVCVFKSEANQVVLLHRIRTTKQMEWIGKLLFTGDDLLIAGFKSTRFHVWSSERQQSIVDFECGGGHRSWDMVLTTPVKQSDMKMVLVCIRKGNVKIWSSRDVGKIMSSVVRKGFHGDKIWCITRLFTKDNVDFYATGGEDNLLVISKMTTSEESKEKTIVPLLHLTGHISCVRALAVHPLVPKKRDDVDQCILVSAGGRAQLIVWKIILNKDVLTPVQLCSHFLWTSDAPPRLIKKSSLDLSAPLTRYMDISLGVHLKDGKLQILIACSDACIRVFHFSVEPPELSFIACIEEGSWCHLKIMSVALPTVASAFLTGSTCGTLRLWSCDNEKLPQLRVMSSISAHDAGINCLNVSNFDDTTIVGTGGDDNCVTLTSLKHHAHKFQILTKVRSAHASQVIGIYLAKSPYGVVITASVDQRLTVWHWRDKPKENSLLELSKCVCTSVCDPAALAVNRRNDDDELRVCLVGGGIQVFHFAIQQSS